jgi:hypothetical protein
MKKDYETILADFLKWLDTLGYAATLVRNGKLSTRPFLKWLESKQIYNINQLTGRHITEYHACLETRPNKIYKGQTLGVAYRVWQSLARAEPIDVFPLLRPLAIGLCIMFFSSFTLGTMNGVLSPVVHGCSQMLETQTFDMQR